MEISIDLADRNKDFIDYNWFLKLNKLKPKFIFISNDKSRLAEFEISIPNDHNIFAELHWDDDFKSKEYIPSISATGKTLDDVCNNLCLIQNKNKPRKHLSEIRKAYKAGYSRGKRESVYNKNKSIFFDKDDKIGSMWNTSKYYPHANIEITNAYELGYMAGLGASY